MWDDLDHVISSLAGRHRILLQENNGVHLRILGMLLRFMLLSVRGTEGVVSNESVMNLLLTYLTYLTVFWEVMKLLI